MVHYFQAIGVALLALILVQLLKQETPGIGSLLSMGGCVLILLLVIEYIRPVADFIRMLAQMTKLDTTLTKTMFKMVGIAIVAEIAELLCGDGGNQAIGKTIQLLASALILYLSLPMMTAFLELIEGILGEL